VKFQNLLKWRPNKARNRPDKIALRRFVVEDHTISDSQGYDNSLNYKTKDDYHQLEALWSALESYPAELDPLLDWSALKNSKKAPSRYRKTLFAVAASIVVVLSLLLSMLKPATDYYQTGRGEQHLVELVDGTELRLNSLSRVVVSYNNKLRQVKIERGEAFFKVAKDPSRKFIVDTEKGLVEAIGTQFNVNLLQRALIVTVTEGEGLVSNYRKEAAERAAEIVVAGQQIAVNSDGKITNREPENLQSTLAWIDRKLIFTGQELEQAVEQVNRHNKQRILILDARLQKLPIYGVFNTGDNDGFLSALEKAYQLKAIDSVTGEIYLVYRGR